MAALALILFLVVIIIAITLATVRLLKGLAKTGGDEKAFARQHVAANGHEFERNRARLCVYFLVIWASGFVIPVYPALGWTMFALSSIGFISAFADAVLDSYADKELNGGFEVDRDFAAA